MPFRQLLGTEIQEDCPRAPFPHDSLMSIFFTAVPDLLIIKKWIYSALGQRCCFAVVCHCTQTAAMG